MVKILKRDIKVAISIDKSRQMYDDNGIPMAHEKFEKLFLDKVTEVIKEYILEGVESDFLISEFGEEEAEDFKYYGEVELKING